MQENLFEKNTSFSSLAQTSARPIDDVDLPLPSPK